MCPLLYLEADNFKVLYFQINSKLSWYLCFSLLIHRGFSFLSFLFETSLTPLLGTVALTVVLQSLDFSGSNLIGQLLNQVMETND